MAAAADVLAGIEQGVARVRDVVGPAVIGLGRGWGRGSGVVVAPGRALAVLTAPPGAAVEVTRGDGRVVEATVAGAARGLGLAVLTLDTGDAAPVAWDPAGAGAAPGRSVFALARPGGRALRASWGLVTTVEAGMRGRGGRGLRGAIEHSAPLPRGSAGGPLVDAGGHLLGVNLLRMDGGLILAVPADERLAERVDALAAGGGGGHRRLGVACSPPWVARRMRRAVGLPDRDGVLVREVEPGGPGERAGLQRGDLVVAAGGREVGSIDDLQDAIDAPAAAGGLELVVVRGVEEVALRAEPAPAEEVAP